MGEIQNPGPDFSGSGPVEYAPAEAAARGPVEQVVARESARLLAIPGVTSVGIGHGPTGGEAISIGVVDAGVAANLPYEIDGVPVMVTVTGEVEAQPR